MSLLEIKKYPDSVLKKKTESVEKITPEIKNLITDMMETMQKANGVGLAAPQVGISKKIIIVKTESGPSVFINPKILKKNGKGNIEEEGCLSFPEIFLKIKRAENIEVEALDGNCQKIRFKAKDILARIFQHEIDHLNRVLIIDKIPFYIRFWRRWKIIKQIKITNNKK